MDPTVSDATGCIPPLQIKPFWILPFLVGTLLSGCYCFESLPLVVESVKDSTVVNQTVLNWTAVDPAVLDATVSSAASLDSTISNPIGWDLTSFGIPPHGIPPF